MPNTCGMVTVPGQSAINKRARVRGTRNTDVESAGDAETFDSPVSLRIRPLAWGSADLERGSGVCRDGERRMGALDDATGLRCSITTGVSDTSLVTGVFKSLLSSPVPVDTRRGGGRGGLSSSVLLELTRRGPFEELCAAGAARDGVRRLTEGADAVLIVIACCFSSLRCSRRAAQRATKPGQQQRQHRYFEQQQQKTKLNPCSAKYITRKAHTTFMVEMRVDVFHRRKPAS